MIFFKSFLSSFHVPLKKSTRVGIEKELPEKPQPLEKKEVVVWDED
jgi:hypothetical protein